MVTIARPAAQTRAYHIFGHVCWDYSTPVVRLSKQQGADTRNRVLGIEGLERGKLMTPDILRERTGLSIQQVAEKNGWDLFKLPGSKGGPAGSAALAVFQLATRGSVAFRGAVGDDRTGQKIAEYFAGYNMDPSTLITLKGVPTSYTLVINESVDNGDGPPTESRTFLHDPGANAALKFEDIPAEALEMPGVKRNIVMAGGTFLMPGIHPAGIMKLFGAVRDQGARTILNTVYDASGKWDLGESAASRINLLIIDRIEAEGISGLAGASMPALMNWFKSNEFDNTIITDGVNGAHGSFTVAEDVHQDFSIPASALIGKLSDHFYGLGAGDCFAGASAVALGEGMDPLSLLIFASSAGGVAGLHKPGEIGGPVKQGGHRHTVNGVFNRMLRQIREAGLDQGRLLLPKPGHRTEAEFMAAITQLIEK